MSLTINRLASVYRANCIPDFGRFSLRTAHAVLRSNLPHSGAHAPATGSHADGLIDFPV